MNAIFTLLLSGLLCFGVATGLAGCKDSSEATPVPSMNQDGGPYDPALIKKLEEEKIARFEVIRAANRKNLATKAQQTPEKVERVTLSLFEPASIKYLEEFEKTYPKLNIVETSLDAGGARSWTTFNPAMLSITDELKKVIEEKKKEYGDDLRSAENMDPTVFSAEKIKRSIVSRKAYVDALNAGEIKTYAFTVEGKLKDIETMTQKEYDGKYLRVVNVNFLLEGVHVGTPYDPEYARALKK